MFPVEKGLDEADICSIQQARTTSTKAAVGVVGKTEVTVIFESLVHEGFLNAKDLADSPYVIAELVIHDGDPPPHVSRNAATRHDTFNYIPCSEFSLRYFRGPTTNKAKPLCHRGFFQSFSVYI